MCDFADCMEGWTEVFVSNRQMDAELVKAMLEDNGIEAVVLSKIDRSLLFGSARVMCNEADRERALQLINNEQDEITE